MSDSGAIQLLFATFASIPFPLFRTVRHRYEANNSQPSGANISPGESLEDYRQG
jgi:hypothetical protein